MEFVTSHVKIIAVTLIAITFSTPLYASDWGGALQGVNDGLRQGLENSRRIEEMRLMREQRRMMEEQRRQLEEERRLREERQVKTNDFVSYMDSNIPDWRQIAKDPAFTEWLNENSKMQALKDAAAELNPYGVSRILNEYKESLQNRRSLATNSNPNEVNLTKNGGVYEVPVTLNGVLSIYFILDSGASDISISPDVALTLIKTKTIKKKDWLPGAYYKFADGTTAKSKRFKLKSVKIGNIEMTDVTCSISNSIEAPMLLGQSALQKLRSYTIDYRRNVMIFNLSEK